MAGGEDVLPVLATTAVAGIIVGVVTLTGLGLRAAGLIVGLAGGSLPLTVVFAAAAVWILGLAVPVTASYIISAVMVVPALTQVGVAPVAAHMFIFYYAVLSEVSPPTALAPFAAAAITGGRPFRTMMLTWKYALPAFLVPFAFTLDPRGLGLLLRSGWGDVAMSSLTAAAGVAALAIAFSGQAFRRATLIERVLAGTGGLCLFYAAPLADVVGVALAAIALVLNWSRRGKDRHLRSFFLESSQNDLRGHFCYRFGLRRGRKQCEQSNDISAGACARAGRCRHRPARAAGHRRLLRWRRRHRVAQARPAATQAAAARITTPKEELGYNVGDDYFLANYQQLMAYWRKLEKESPRIHVEEIGRTAMKKPHLMAIITAPENYKNLAKYKDISRRLSLAEGLTDEQARALARDGKSVVWIDGGLHASEVLGAQQLLETVYQLVSGTDAGDDQNPERRHRAGRLGEPGRDGPGFGRLHEAHGHDGRASRPLQLLRGARQQPRLGT